MGVAVLGVWTVHARTTKIDFSSKYLRPCIYVPRKSAQTSPARGRTHKMSTEAHTDAESEHSSHQLIGSTQLSAQKIFQPLIGLRVHRTFLSRRVEQLISPHQKMREQTSINFENVPCFFPCNKGIY